MRLARLIYSPWSLMSAAALGLVASLAVPPVFAQAGSGEKVGSAPVAFVYVSYDTGSGTGQVAGYAAAPDGKLHWISGSPFHANVLQTAATHNYFFASERNGRFVASYWIESNGTLKWLHSKLAEVSLPGQFPCGYPGSLVLDHTGATLYRAETVGDLCENLQWQSFGIDKTNGRLTLLGSSSQNFLWNYPLSFTGNNQFAYGSQCVNYRGFPTDTMTGYRRDSSGLLELGTMSLPVPKPKNTDDFYCRSNPAADPANHLALALTETNFNDPFGTTYAAQLATYTADGSGNLTTGSTWANMPSTDVVSVSDMKMSPSGQLLAVGGSGGLQVFHFNGAHPITHDTGLLTTAPITMVAWDNNHHLYAISGGSSGKLYVFTVTPTSWTQAPGSPWSIASPEFLTVQSRTDSDGDRDHD